MESADAVESAVDLFEQVSENSRRTDSGIREISDTTDDQAASTEETVSIVEEVAEINRTTADGAGAVSAAAEQQASSVASVGDTVESLVSAADRLEATLRAFETGGGSQLTPEAPSGSGAATGDDGRPK